MYRYDAIHAKGICLPDDAFKDRTAGQGGHIKLWTVVERVQGDLSAAEAGYKEDMANEQDSFAESLSQLSSHVDKLASYTDIDKVRRIPDGHWLAGEYIDSNAPLIPTRYETRV